MAGMMDTLIREMTMMDHGQIYGLWTEIKSFGIRSVNDSWDGVERFLRRNPTTSAVAVRNGHITGNILRSHGGRAGCFYHVCVVSGYRRHGIGYRMVHFAMEVPQKEGVSKISLIALKGNKVGNASRQGIGRGEREDANTYEFVLNEESITRFAR